MAVNYNYSRKMKSASVGTIMPWAGQLAPDGWLSCNGQTLQARQFPLLASIIGNTYGGTIATSSANLEYSNTDTFRLPSLNQTVLADQERRWYEDASTDDTAELGEGRITFAASVANVVGVVQSFSNLSITGIATEFTRELKIGGIIFTNAAVAGLPGSGEPLGTVVSITNDTTMEILPFQALTAEAAPGIEFRFNNYWIQSPDADYVEDYYGDAATGQMRGFGASSNLANTSAQSQINFDLLPTNTFTGRIRGITVNDPSYSRTIHTFPRKLGINHLPDHIHSGGIATVEPTGTYGARFSRVSTSVTQDNGKIKDCAGDRWASETGTLTASASWTHSSFNPFDPTTINLAGFTYSDFGAPVKNQGPFRMPTYIGVFPPKRNDLGDSRNTGPLSSKDDYDDNVNFYGGKRNFFRPDNMPVNYIGNTSIRAADGTGTAWSAFANRDRGGVEPYTWATTVSNNSEKFYDYAVPIADEVTNTVRAHNHASFELSMTKGSLGIPGTIAVNNVQTGPAGAMNIAAENLQDAINISVNSATPSLSMLYIIRAY